MRYFFAAQSYDRTRNADARSDFSVGVEDRSADAARTGDRLLIIYREPSGGGERKIFPQMPEGSDRLRSTGFKANAMQGFLHRC